MRGTPFRASFRTWDWLGDGVYFWLDGPERALLWARERRYLDPVVVAADLDLTTCLDLTRPAHQALVRSMHMKLLAEAVQAGLDLPENSDLKLDPYHDRKNRSLDRLVINSTCLEVEAAYNDARAHGQSSPMAPFASVRGVFQEGGPVYPGAGFHEASHVQVAVRDLSCIRNVRRVSDL